MIYRGLNRDICAFADLFNDRLQGYFYIGITLFDIWNLISPYTGTVRFEKLISKLQEIQPKNESLRPKTFFYSNTTKNWNNYRFSYRYTVMSPYLKSITKRIIKSELSNFIRKSDEIGFIAYSINEGLAEPYNHIVWYIQDKKLHMIDADDNELDERTIDVVLNTLDPKHKDYITNLTK